MVTPTETMDLVLLAVADSGDLPAEMSVLKHEADIDNENSDVELPLLEVQIADSERVEVSNDDLVGWTTDGSGNRTGRIYESEYELTLELRIWTIPKDGYNVDRLGDAVRSALYPYSSYGPQKSFRDESGETVDQIYYFTISDGARADDLIQTPNVRRWRQEVELWGCEEFRTTEDYIVAVDYPQDGDFNDSDNDGVIENT